MSPAMILGAAGSLIGSVVAGVALGSYATDAPTGRWAAPAERESIAEQMGNPDAAYGPASTLAAQSGGAEPVVCKGCGPTLTERRMAAEEARFARLGYGMGADDPVVQDYMRDAATEPHWRARPAIENHAVDETAAAEPAPSPAPRVAVASLDGAAALPVAARPVAARPVVLVDTGQWSN